MAGATKPFCSSSPRSESASAWPMRPLARSPPVINPPRPEAPAARIPAPRKGDGRPKPLPASGAAAHADAAALPGPVHWNCQKLNATPLDTMTSDASLPAAALTPAGTWTAMGPPAQPHELGTFTATIGSESDAYTAGIDPDSRLTHQ